MSYVQGPAETAPAAKKPTSQATEKAVECLRVAGTLVEIMTFLRATAISRDFFEGYSLSEAIQERLDLIGGGSYYTTQAPTGAPTLLEELTILETAGLEAIKAAKECDPPTVLPERLQNFDAKLISTYSDALIEQGSNA